jgi:hypothetical protein
MADETNINDIATKLQQFAEKTLKIESSSSRIEAITKSIAAQYGQMAQKNTAAGIGFTRLTGGMTTKSKELAEIQQLLTKALIQQNNVMARRERLMEASFTIQSKLDKAASNPKLNKPEILGPLQKQLDTVTAKIVALDQESEKLAGQIEFLKNTAAPAATEIGKLGNATKALGAGAFLTGFGQLLTFSHELNKAVIQTNTSLTHRAALLDASLDTQIATGASAKTLLEIQREMASIGARILDDQVTSSAQAMKLVHGGEMTAKAYRETLETANMLVEGLGSSVREAVQLQITARTSNTGYRELANTISKITASTGLAADEAARYARSLLIASKIAVGNNAKFDDKVYKRNLIALAGIEGAIKDSVGVQGEISEMLVRFSSFKKDAGVGLMFGTGGIDFLQKGVDKTSAVIENIARQTQGLSGPMLEMYADITGLSPQTLIALGEEFKKAQEKGVSFAKFYAERQELFAQDSDLQDRYNKQLALQGETFSRLGKLLVVLAGSALAPVLRGLNWLSVKLLDIFKLLGPDGPLGPIAKWLKFGFGIIATGFLVTKLWDTTRALFAFTASLIRLSTQLKASAIENTLAGGLGGGLGGGKGTVVKEVAKDAAQTTILRRILQSITGALGGIRRFFAGGVLATLLTVGRPKVSDAVKPIPGAKITDAITAGFSKVRLFFESLKFSKITDAISSGFGKVKTFVKPAQDTNLSGTLMKFLSNMSDRLGTLFRGFLVKLTALWASTSSVVRGLFSRGPRIPGAPDVPITKQEVNGLVGFFRNVLGNAKGFFGKIFGKAAATTAAEGLASTASKGILARLLGGLTTFFGGTLLRTIGGTLLRVLFGLVGGLPGLIISIVLMVFPLIWPKLKSWFGSDKNKTVGAGISLNDLERKAINGFTKGMVANDGKSIEVSEKAYQALIKSTGKTPEELEQLNKNIVAALDRKIDVQSGAHQRAQGVDKAQDVQNAKALSDQIRTLGELSNRLNSFARNYKEAEDAKKKAQAEREEEMRRASLTASSMMIN